MTRSIARLMSSAFAAGMIAFAGPALAGQDAMKTASVEVGGAPMMADKRIPENAAKASNLSTLVAALGAAGLVDPEIPRRAIEPARHGAQQGFGAEGHGPGRIRVRP